MLSRSASMKLLLGAIAYLCFVAAVVVATLVGVSSIERHSPAEGPVLAADDTAASRERVPDATVDPNRVPVWIVATAKYHYTPVPVDQKPKHSAVIGRDARSAMARTHPPRKAARKATQAASAERSQAASGFMWPFRQDMYPFNRD